MKLRLPGFAGRASWNLVDQVISSATNAVLSFVIARSVDAAAFGGFAVAFTVFSVVIGVSRAVGTSPLAIRFADAGPGSFRRATSSAVGFGVALGVGAGLGCVGVGIAIGGVTGQAMLALGVVLPALLAQDAWRFVFFAAGRPAAATLNDAVWAVVQVATVAAVLRAENPQVGWFLLAWGGAAAVAALVGVRQGQAWPRLQDARAWLADHRSLTGYLLAEFGTLQGFHQGAFAAIAVVGSLEAIGALRGAQILLGPVTILAVAALSFTVPELARRRGKLDRRRWLQCAGAVSGACTILGLAIGVVCLAIPDAVGRQLLGDTWQATEAVLWPTIVGQVGAALPAGAGAALIAMGRAKATFSLNAFFGPALFLGGIGGVLLAGAPGAAWGFAAAFWVMVPFWWIRLYKELSRRPATAASHVVSHEVNG